MVVISQSMENVMSRKTVDPTEVPMVEIHDIAPIEIIVIINRVSDKSFFRLPAQKSFE
jgi:hypothetical protein